MAFVWNEEMIRFLCDAAEEVGFYRELARSVVPLLPPRAHVCDAGCGLGYLTLALAESCRQVTAVDTEPAVLDVLARNLRAKSVSNVRVVQGSAFELPAGVRFDAMVFCFFGSIGETLKTARTHCGGPLILFKKDWRTHRFSLTESRLEKFTAEQTRRELERLGVPYKSRRIDLEMGQPFRSLADAAAFFSLYNRSPDAPPPTEAELAVRLQSTGDSRFPYYLPSRRPLAMITIDAGEIPADISEICDEEGEREA